MITLAKWSLLVGTICVIVDAIDACADAVGAAAGKDTRREARGDLKERGEGLEEAREGPKFIG
jgi:hypothetical protein